MSTNEYTGDDRSRDTNEGTVQIDDDADRSELIARLKEVAEENEQLRTANEQLRYSTRTSRPQSQRFGLALALLGTLSALSVFVFPDAQNVLFALAGTGLFGGVLTYYLSGDHVLPASVCDGIYSAVATNGTAIADELDLRADRIYIPDGNGGARLFVPQHSEHAVPDVLDGLFVAGDRERGVVLKPTGAALFCEFDRTAAGTLSDAPSELVAQLADATVEQFELAGTVDASVSASDGEQRVTVTVADSRVGAVDRFDHPITSFLAVGLAVGLECPVEFEGATRTNRAEWHARYHWNESGVD